MNSGLAKICLPIMLITLGATGSALGEECVFEDVEIPSGQEQETATLRFRSNILNLRDSDCFGEAADMSSLTQRVLKLESTLEREGNSVVEVEDRFLTADDLRPAIAPKDKLISGLLDVRASLTDFMEGAEAPWQYYFGQMRTALDDSIQRLKGSLDDADPKRWDYAGNYTLLYDDGAGEDIFLIDFEDQVENACGDGAGGHEPAPMGRTGYWGRFY